MGSGSGIEYERQRYARALQAASAAAAAAAGEGGAAGAASEAEDAAAAVVAEALPITAAWLRQTLLEVRLPSTACLAFPPLLRRTACLALFFLKNVHICLALFKLHSPPGPLSVRSPLAQAANHSSFSAPAWPRCAHSFSHTPPPAQAPPPAPDSPQRPDPAFARACLASGLLLLLQRPQAVSTVDCPGKPAGLGACGACTVATTWGWLGCSRCKARAASGQPGWQSEHLHVSCAAGG